MTLNLLLGGTDEVAACSVMEVGVRDAANSNAADELRDDLLVLEASHCTLVKGEVLNPRGGNCAPELHWWTATMRKCWLGIPVAKKGLKMVYKVETSKSRAGRHTAHRMLHQLDGERGS